jgi:2-phospho-L-lactate transferase/gluconeogenesis factor (CofD/UPF0052 family)
MSLGNMVFAGRYLQDNDFNKAVQDFTQGAECRVKIMNVTQGENLYLYGWRTNNGVCDEGSMCSEPSIHPIKDIRLLDMNEPHGQARIPELNPALRCELATSTVIVYGPGTQHSSLLPSYLTHELSDLLAQVSGYKVYVANLHRDVDTPVETVAALQEKFMAAMNAGWSKDGFRDRVYWHDLVNVSLVQWPEAGLPIGDCFGALDLRDWRSPSGKQHDGDMVVSAVCI